MIWIVAIAAILVGALLLMVVGFLDDLSELYDANSSRYDQQD